MTSIKTSHFRVSAFLAFTALCATHAFAVLPKSANLVESMGFGINIGNTMEVPGDPTLWGNPFPTETYIKAIKAAGFSSVRIPCAWDSHAKDGVINTTWLDSVKTVVDLVIDNGMYAVLNSHWDGGWLEDHVFDGDGYTSGGETITSKASDVAALQEKYWTQIASKFKNYDEHLIFASANEPGVNDPWIDGSQIVFTDERMKVLQQFHEACINAVRATGGNNATRTIVVQMPRTEIDNYEILADNYPVDPAGDGYTMAEAHYYPYQFSLMEEDAGWGNPFFYFDGMGSTTDEKHNMGSAATTLGTKAYTEDQFSKLEDAFGDKGIPVIIGEFGAIKRFEDITGNNLKLHLQGRAAWYGSVAKSAKAHNMVVFAWDTGAESNGNMTIIRRQTDVYEGNVGDIVDYEVLNAMRKEYSLDTLKGNSIDGIVSEISDDSDKMLRVTYASKTADSSEVGTMRIDLGGKDWSDYVAISFQAKIDVETNGPCTKSTKYNSCEYAWKSLDIFAMSGSNWAWTNYNFEESDIAEGQWKTYTITLDSKGLEFDDPKTVKAIGLNYYGTQLSGTMDIDNVLLIKADGTVDTLQNFNTKKPSTEGIASGKLVASTAPTASTQSSSSSAKSSSSKATSSSSAVKQTSSSFSKTDVPEQEISSSSKTTASSSSKTSASSSSKNTSGNEDIELPEETKSSSSSKTSASSGTSSETDEGSSSSKSGNNDSSDEDPENSDSDGDEQELYTAGKWSSANTKISLDGKDLFIGRLDGTGNRTVSREFSFEKGSDYEISFSAYAEEADDLELTVKLANGKTVMCSEMVVLTSKKKTTTCKFTATKENGTLTLTVLGDDGYVTISNFTRNVDTDAIKSIATSDWGIQFANNILYFNGTRTSKTKIQVFDPMGNSVKNQTVENFQSSVPLNNLSRGKYIVKFNNGTSTRVLPITIK